MLNIKNNNIKIFIETILNKSINVITESDLKGIKNFCFTCESEYHENDFEILDSLSNIENIIVNGYELTQEDIDKLFSINCRSITFKKCLFDKSLTIKKNSIRELHFQRCCIDDYDSIVSSNNDMETFEVSNPFDENEINCELFPSKLKVLILNYCLLLNANSLSRLVDCSYFSALGTVFDDSNLNFLSDMISLDNLYISEMYGDNSQVNSKRESCDVKYDYIDLLFEREEEPEEKGNTI